MIRESILADHAALTEIRREIHRHPELMFQEHNTSAIVQRELSKIGVEFVAGLAKGTGVLGYLPATEPGGSTIALRADMDALPITEDTGVPYTSECPGVMHACGHDGHTAILIGVARALAKETVRRNNVLFVFQPAEEGGAGGEQMCLDGCLDGSRLGTKADVIYGLHGWPEVEKNRLLWKVGPMMAATNEFRIRVNGRGGHAAAPHLTIDPVVAAAQIIVALQSIAARNIDPLDSIVFTVGAIHGGEANNVIPDYVDLRGTMRTLRAETQEYGEQRFREVVNGIATAMGCTVEIQWPGGYPVTFNEKTATLRFRQLAEAKYGDMVEELVNPVMGGEDFSYYGAYVPACFYFLGLRRDGDENPASVHTPRFDFNDEVIPTAVEMMTELALQPLDLAPASSNGALSHA